MNGHERTHVARHGKIAAFFVILSACGADPPRVAMQEGLYSLQGGGQYRLTYASPLDGFAPGTRWTGAALEGSPLDSMGRRPLILKADDFGKNFNREGRRFVEMLQEYRARAAIGIVTGWLTDSEEDLETYRKLDAAGFELWFHGHLHDYTPPIAEFSGRSQEAQAGTLERGVIVARDHLGIDFHTFGAPGNGIDENTGPALCEVPQFVAWLFGYEQPGLMVFPRLFGVEERPGRVRDPAGFFEDLDGYLSSDLSNIALTLQIHPLGWGDADFDRFEAVLRGISGRKALRYSSPYDIWSWVTERERIILTKDSETTYVLDLSAAALSHRIDLDPADGPLPIRITTLP